MNFIQWLQSFLSDETGKGSSRRIIELAVTWTFIFSYVKVALYTQTLPTLDIGWVLLLAGILGIKSVSDYYQGKIQNNNSNNK